MFTVIKNITCRRVTIERWGNQAIQHEHRNWLLKPDEMLRYGDATVAATRWSDGAASLAAAAPADYCVKCYIVFNGGFNFDNCTKKIKGLFREIITLCYFFVQLSKLKPPLNGNGSGLGRPNPFLQSASFRAKISIAVRKHSISTFAPPGM